MEMRTLALSLVLVVAVSAATDAAQWVVIDSTAPGFEVGQILDDSRPLDVPAGASLTVIGEDGTVTAIAGPFSGVPGGKASTGASGLMEALSRLVRGEGASAASLATMRQAGPIEPPDPWAIDITRSGDHCVRAEGAPALWRASAGDASTLTIRAFPTGPRSKTEWPAGADTVAWPGDVPIADGADFMVRLNGRPTAARITLRVAPTSLPSEAHYAAWMAEAGCRQQAQALLAGLAK
jgi:hypothetical protein